ncbi:hypothetical protein ACIQMR_15700 [Streptomyces sp. NPDC091376]
MARARLDTAALAMVDADRLEAKAVTASRRSAPSRTPRSPPY